MWSRDNHRFWTNDLQVYIWLTLEEDVWSVVLTGEEQKLTIQFIRFPSVLKKITKEDEINADVEEKVLQVHKKIDTTISKDAIDVVHRLKGKPKTDQNKKCPSIIVRFIARKTRNNIYSSRKKLKSAEFDDPHIDRVFIMKLLPVVKNPYLLKPIKKEKIYIGNIGGLTMGGSISETMKMMQTLQSKQKTTCIVSGITFYDSGFMRLSCGGELLLCLLLAFTLFTNASLMTSFTLPSHPNGCKWSMCCLQFAHWLQNDVHNLQKVDSL